MKKTHLLCIIFLTTFPILFTACTDDNEFIVTDITVERTIDTGNAALITRIGDNFYYAGMNDMSNNLGVIDFSNPENPVISGTYATGVGFGYGITTDGKNIFVQTDGGAYNGEIGEFISFNVADPDNITVLHRTSEGYDSAYQIYYYKGYLISASGYSISIHSISTSGEMNFESSFDVEFVQWLCIHNDHIYFADQSNFKIYDIADPASPQHKATYAIDALSVAVKGDYAYIPSRRNSTLTVLDISDHDNITVAGTLSVTNATSVNGEAKIRGDYLFIVNNEYFGVIDISEPANMVEVSHVTLSNNTGWGFEFYNDDYVLVCDEDDIKVVKILH